MVERYTDRITAYCEEQGITIPQGFFRHPSSQYAVIDMGTTPSRLVAKTWFRQEDAIYYLEHLAGDRTLKVIDFQDGRFLEYRGGRLHRGEPVFTD
ncbi:MAG: hypothetical protein U0412_07165 [Nitrospira sp.]